MRSPSETTAADARALLMAAQSAVSEHMEAIVSRFKPGVKITVLVRTPGFPGGERDLLMTDDDLGEAIKAIEIRRAAGMDAEARA